MKIFIVAHPLRAGGGRATCMNLLRAIQTLDKKHQYFLVLPDQPEYRELKLEDKRHEIYYYRRTLGHLGRWFFDAFTLKRLLKSYAPDIVWSMGGVGFQYPPCPQAVSIQNPHMMYESAHTGRLSLVDKLWLFFLRRAFRNQLPQTQLVFCQTATMEARLRDVYGYAGRTQVTWKAVSAFILPQEEPVPGPLQPYADRFKLFYVTRYYPHKGIDILVEVMEKYAKELDGVLLVLTISPEQHPNAARLVPKIDSSPHKNVLNVGPLAQRELGGYYQHCDALLMPTRLESFSGTYLEAMHFGLPILTSDLDFAQEVCADAALYFDPWSPTAIRDVILQIRSHPTLAAELRQRGRDRLRAMQKSWEDIAAQVLAELEKLRPELPTGSPPAHDP